MELLIKRVVNIIIDFRSKKKREWSALLATFFSVFNKLVSLLAVFLYVRWTVPYLGNERFGVWMTLSTFIVFINIFSDFGLGSSLVNYVAYSKANDDSTSLKKYTSSAFFFLLITSLFIGVIGYFLIPAGVSTVGNGLSSGEEIQEVRNSLLCLTVIFAINLPFVVVDKTLEGLQLTYISSIWGTVGNVLSLIGTYFVTQQSLGIVWLIISTVGIQSAFRAIYFFIEFNGRLKIAKPSLKRVSFHNVSSLFRFGLIFFLLNVFNVLAFQVDNIIISKEIGVGNVALFSLMQKLVTISFFFWFYTISLWPAFAEAYAKGDKLWIKKTVNFVLKLNLLLGVSFGLIIIFFSPAILSFWAKGEVQSPTFTMSLGFALYILMNGFLGAVALVFNTGPLHKKHVVGFCTAAIITILLKFLLIGELGVDYLMYIPFLPFLLFYIIPCYIKYKKYVQA